MASLKSIRENRLKKLSKLKKANVNPYPESSNRTHTCIEAINYFEKLCKKEICLAGRVRSIRTHGGSTFLHIQDSTSKFQIYLKRDILGEKSYELFLETIDIGDFIEVGGNLFITKRGEKTLEAKSWRILAKSLLPLPEKWHGLKDIEKRSRKRYLDLIMNDDIKKRFEIRSLIIRLIREFLHKKGFIEVETPILQSIAGGALATPFMTHLNALNLDLYLRIAPELYLKRLLVGGFEKIFEIGKCFRNEGIDASHNPEFTMLEFYWAYADYKNLMSLTEEMFNDIISNLKSYNLISEKEIDFSVPWKKVEFDKLIEENTGINIWKAKIEDLHKKIEQMDIDTEIKLVKSKSELYKAKLIDEIFKKVCVPKLINPVFVINHPKFMSPLAKPLEEEPHKSARFQLIISGIEIANAYSELNDPILQKEMLISQEKAFKRGEEAQRYDKDFITALEYGMPPAAGFGMGLDRLAMILTNCSNLRDIILFPFMKPKE